MTCGERPVASSTRGMGVWIYYIAHNRATLKGGSMVLMTKISDQTRVYVCMVMTYVGSVCVCVVFRFSRLYTSRVWLPILLAVS